MYGHRVNFMSLILRVRDTLDTAARGKRRVSSQPSRAGGTRRCFETPRR